MTLSGERWRSSDGCLTACRAGVAKKNASAMLRKKLDLYSTHTKQSGTSAGEFGDGPGSLPQEGFMKLDFAKTVAALAALGLTAACGGSTPEAATPEAPAESAEAAEGAPVGEASAAQTAPAAEGESATAEGKECCKAMNECKGKGGCAVEGKHECKGNNECKGQGGCNGHCPK